MPEQLPASPDVYTAATWIATKDGISVDTALWRLQRAARTAGLTSGEIAHQVVGSLKVLRHGQG